MIVVPVRRIPRGPYVSARTWTGVANSSPGFISFNYTMANGDNVRYDFAQPPTPLTQFQYNAAINKAFGFFDYSPYGGILWNYQLVCYLYNKHKY